MVVVRMDASHTSSLGFQGPVTFRLDEWRVQFEAFATANGTATVKVTPDEDNPYSYQSNPAGVWTHNGTGGPLEESFLIQAGDDLSTSGAQGPFGSRFSLESAAPNFPPNSSIRFYAE